jgi:hypothetical protein
MIYTAPIIASELIFVATAKGEARIYSDHHEVPLKAQQIASGHTVASSPVLVDDLFVAATESGVVKAFSFRE